VLLKPGKRGLKHRAGLQAAGGDAVNRADPAIGLKIDIESGKLPGGERALGEAFGDDGPADILLGELTEHLVGAGVPRLGADAVTEPQLLAGSRALHDLSVLAQIAVTYALELGQWVFG